MSAPTDELPAIEVEGYGRPWRAVISSPALTFKDGEETRDMTLPDLIALVIALPDDEQALALTEALSERFAKTGRADDWWANVLEDKSKRVESLTAELGAVRAELASAYDRVADSIGVATFALHGLPVEHAERALYLVRKIIYELRDAPKPSPPASQGVCGTCGGDGFYVHVSSNESGAEQDTRQCTDCGGSGRSPEEKRDG